MVISGRFVLLLAAGVIPVVLTGSPLALAGWVALVVVVGTIDAIIAGSPRRVTPERAAVPRIRLGETARAELFLTNTGSRTVRAVVRDGWQPSAGAHATRTRVRLPAGERRLVTTTLTPFRRGERRAEVVAIRSFGPLGLMGRQAAFALPGGVRVLPPFTSRKHLPSRLARLRELDGRTSLMIRGQGTEFDSLRDYVRGDDVRSIDWRATARRSAVVVRTWRPERDRRVVIVIDTGRTSAARIDNESRLDTAFESALLLAALATRAGDRVDVILFDRRVRGRVAGAVGADLLARMVDTMAPIDPELLATEWSAVPALVREVTSQRSLVVLLTTADSPASARPLLSMLPQLTRTHVVMVAGVSDPAVVDAADTRSDRTEVYRAAAAERAMLDRDRVALAVHQVGADVISGRPADLPPAVADRYLQLKAAGRL